MIMQFILHKINDVNDYFLSKPNFRAFYLIVYYALLLKSVHQGKKFVQLLHLLAVQCCTVCIIFECTGTRSALPLCSLMFWTLNIWSIQVSK